MTFHFADAGTAATEESLGFSVAPIRRLVGVIEFDR